MMACYCSSLFGDELVKKQAAEDLNCSCWNLPNWVNCSGMGREHGYH